MSDLPVSLPAALEPAFLAAFDRQGKLIAALDALGPLADRDVLVVAINAGETAVTLPLPLQSGPTGLHGTVALAAGRARSERAAIVAFGDTVSVELPPRAGVVVQLV